MRKSILTFLFVLCGYVLWAQSMALDVRSRALAHAQKGDYKKAIALLENVFQEYKTDVLFLKDLAYYHYLQRDNAKAIEYAQIAIKLPETDEAIFQVWASALKDEKKYTEAEGVYYDAIAKFPHSAILYAELGEILHLNNMPTDAQAIWQKGIHVDPNVSANYYYLSKACTLQNPLKSVLLAETFLNMEFKTNRSLEMRTLLYETYKRIFTSDSIINSYEQSSNYFEKAVASILKKNIMPLSNGVTPERLVAVKTQFIIEWYLLGNDKKYPFALFDRSRQLIKSDAFEAYNIWLFAAYDNRAFVNWAKQNVGKMAEFQRFFNNSILKFTEPFEYFN